MQKQHEKHSAFIAETTQSIQEKEKQVRVDLFLLKVDTKTGLNIIVLPTLFNGCQQYCSASLILHLTQAQYCSILLITMNNVGSKTLLNPRPVLVFLSILNM